MSNIRYQAQRITPTRSGNFSDPIVMDCLKAEEVCYISLDAPFENNDGVAVELKRAADQAIRIAAALNFVEGHDIEGRTMQHFQSEAKIAALDTFMSAAIEELKGMQANGESLTPIQFAQFLQERLQAVVLLGAIGRNMAEAELCSDCHDTGYTGEVDRCNCHAGDREYCKHRDSLDIRDPAKPKGSDE